MRDGIWAPRPHGKLRIGGKDMSVRDYAVYYLDQLSQGGRYPHTVWPVHCVIGTEGNNIMPRLAKSLWAWEDKQIAACGKHSKGSCYWTEHFGAVQAEVPFPGDPTTDLNIGLIQALQEADDLYVAGWATNFCLANTVRDVARAFGSDDHVKKFILLTDCTNAVQGFDVPGRKFMDGLTDDFLTEMKGRGMRTATSKDVL